MKLTEINFLDLRHSNASVLAFGKTVTSILDPLCAMTNADSADLRFGAACEKNTYVS